MMKGIQTLYFICFLLLLISCSSTKYVGEGEYLLDKVERFEALFAPATQL